MSGDTFLAGVRRALLGADDDRALRRAVLEQLHRVVPFDAYAWLLTDPETTVGTAPLAEVPCLDRLERLIALRYGSGIRWTSHPPGVPYRPVRPGSELSGFLSDYGEYDVVSVAFADRYGWWGFLDLWRERGRFVAEETAMLGLLAGPVTAALRASRAAAFVPSEVGNGPVVGQAVLLLAPDLAVRRQTPDAEAQLRALLPTEESRRPVPAAAYNVAAQLLTVEAGLDTHQPVVRTTVAPGRLIAVRAARLGPEIAVTIGPPEQQDRWLLFCRAHALSARETEVVCCLAEGDDTRTLAARLALSEHTVQDHLKSTFEKTGVRSRRELLARGRGA